MLAVELQNSLKLVEALKAMRAHTETLRQMRRNLHEHLLAQPPLYLLTAEGSAVRGALHVVDRLVDEWAKQVEKVV